MAQRQTNQRQMAIALYTSWQLDAKSLRIDDKSAIIVASECCKAYRTIGQSAYRRVIKTTEIRDSSKKQQKKNKIINEYVFIDVIFAMRRKLAE